MNSVPGDSLIAGSNDLILLTGATGFIGRRVVGALLDLGFRNLRCLTRPSSNMDGLDAVLRAQENSAQVEIMTGNLLSTEDCATAAKGVTVGFELAAGKGEKSFPDAFANSVVTTRNLLDSCFDKGGVRRFLNMSSLAVCRSTGNPNRRCVH